MFRRYGVEIEIVNIDRQKLLDNLSRAGIECYYEGYNHRTRPHWKIVTDASVHNGYELVSPILEGEEGLLNIKKVTKAIGLSKRNNDMDTVNRSCGLHIHIDTEGLSSQDIGWIAKRYKDNETSIDNFFPSSRRGNPRYCGSMQTTWVDIDDLVQKHDIPLSHFRGFNFNPSRFSKVNFSKAYTTHKTIEFRQHSGTTDYNKIANWIEFLQNFVEQSIKCKQKDKVSVNYRPNKPSAMFSAVREQVAKLGGKLFYRGTWKIICENGRTHELTTQSIDENGRCTTSNGYATLQALYTNKKLNERFILFMKRYFSRTIEQANGDNDPSLMAEYVREFFKMRTEQLRRSA